MLLAHDRNPDTNTIIIPPVVLDTLAMGFSAGLEIWYHSRITSFPDDGAGVAILTNNDAFGPVMKAALLQLELAGGTRSPTPVNTSLPFELSAMFGTYRNLGYGADIELCVSGCKVPLHSLRRARHAPKQHLSRPARCHRPCVVGTVF
ncbi:hypothetical protein DFH08DRAFT_974767 [Mycena albidolilacea]|uniref:Uncharacterized protein n=1 Tax=Mycena albidolilacea TaxID=1033008 RepID=A0AAD7EC11_9AGAR|nr:hypothetical protein DFH08DRAFT_974767 [Mycena albidolilacea]